MGVECVHDPEFLELTWRFPLEPIEEDRSYQAALEILDRLFELDNRRTPAELAYFMALAKLAFEFEMSHDMIGSSA